MIRFGRNLRVIDAWRLLQLPSKQGAVEVGQLPRVAGVRSRSVLLRTQNYPAEIGRKSHVGVSKTNRDRFLPLDRDKVCGTTHNF